MKFGLKPLILNCVNNLQPLDLVNRQQTVPLVQRSIRNLSLNEGPLPGTSNSATNVGNWAQSGRTARGQITAIRSNYETCNVNDSPLLLFDPDSVEKLSWQGEGNSLAWIVWRGLCGWTYPKERGIINITLMDQLPAKPHPSEELLE
jgi:hypothetical protein